MSPTKHEGLILDTGTRTVDVIHPQTLPPIDAEGLLTAANILEKIVAGESVSADAELERAATAVAQLAGAMGSLIALSACAAIEVAASPKPATLSDPEKDELSRFAQVLREFAPSVKQ
ncbi:hypothetical protein ABH908_000210 [Pseudomonas frederiksbergensis]|uniref:hypothetical protein n=1 Tax=Pseudomonas TaxID=286 RepID=UPI003D237487